MKARPWAVAATTAAIAIGAAIGGTVWRRRHRDPLSYTQRFRVQIPRPLITRGHLFEMLDPRPGERILEVGPGYGYYSLSVADRLGPKGKLDILDIQPRMLRHTLRSARRLRTRNLVAACGSVEALPYRDEVFDGAFLVTVLGEVNDPAAALRELFRVIRPGGRDARAVPGDPARRPARGRRDVRRPGLGEPAVAAPARHRRRIPLRKPHRAAAGLFLQIHPAAARGNGPAIREIRGKNRVKTAGTGPVDRFTRYFTDNPPCARQAPR